MNQRVLIVEDDPDIGALLRLHALDVADEVQLESHGARGLLVAQSRPWDLVILDWRLPGIDGVSICRRLREQGRQLPILLLTARDSPTDLVHGLDSGADDYVTKPFAVAELKARLRAQLRRAQLQPSTPPSASAAEPPALIRHGELSVDRAAHSAQLAGRALDLTSREFELLAWFASNPGRVYTRAQLLGAVWGAGFEGYEHTVNSHINRLRAKIEADPAKPTWIVTVWGIGYRFEGRAPS